jgi:hypothetical protein
VANKTKKSDARDRRAKLEEMRRAQRATERRRNLTFVGLAAVVGIGIIAAAAIPLISKNQQNNKPLTDFGVAASAAQCDAITNDPIAAANHVGPGTGGSNESVGRVNYSTVPPSGGDHFLTPMPIDRHFYTAQDRPPLENLVHNLEHGYTIVWYDSTVTGDQLKTLEDLSSRVPKDGDRRKFIVSAWDDGYGRFPDGKHVAVSHWSGQGDGGGPAGLGHRQLCGQVSGEVIDQFMTQFPFSDAREPNAS